ncbi:hypothetical protein F5Y03DRAFT_194937 [Xylaria venustula]|nr:hypothetical protein F5Y03DRAFT_194937 [Xylaria venustula]
MTSGQAAAGPLEDRLRNLILTNPDSRVGANSDGSLTSAAPSGNAVQAKEAIGSGQAYSDAVRPTPKSGRRRPNQAQRRQMNAELSIPIDTRAPAPLFAGPPRHGQQQNPFLSHSPAYPANIPGEHLTGGSHSSGQSRRSHAQFPAPYTHQPDWRRQQHQQTPAFDRLSRSVNTIPADAHSSRGGRNQAQSQPAFHNSSGHRQENFDPRQLASQSAYLDQLCHQIIAGAEIGLEEIAAKENFRKHVEAICRHVITRHEQGISYARPFEPTTVELKCFGSLASGFATKAADMDLGLLSPMSQLSPNSPESPIPRLIEGALLAAGFGARLLTRTRVPIIKLCETPNSALQQGLLDARKKWEEGIDQEEQELDDDELEDQDSPRDIKPLDSEPHLSPTRISMPQASLVEEKGYLLKQTSNQSLVNYYGKAKRLLRRLNSRDITPSNYRDFSEADFILLDKVARAFVEGLYDANLRGRILAYPSFYIGDKTQLTNYRSLYGVYTMIEGEKLVLTWERRQFASRNPKANQAYEELIRQWTNLQYNKNFGTNPVQFSKELQLAAEAIRQIPPVQIMQLKQEQHESPAQYHVRTQKIAVALSGSLSVDTDIQHQIIQQYIDGIRDEKLRHEVGDFVTVANIQTLRTVARKHKALHLAADYERAIQKGLYHLEDIPVLQNYITILRGDLVQSEQRPTEFEYLIPVLRNEEYILATVKRLADPATLGPNKPKDKYNDSLEFPKSGVGVQCDINFSAHLALQNTALLRCYSLTDRRVRPLVLFIKHWAKARGINTPYRGTLSSYGYVLMVLHYLVNVVEPFVCPNLQELAPPAPDLPAHVLEGVTTCQGRDIRFWRDEQAIQSLAQQGQLNQNNDPLGTLLQGFFEYYAQSNMMTTIRKKGFDWGRDVISLRTHGGLLSKVEKGWTGAKTVVQLRTGSSTAPTELDSTTMQSPPLSSNTPSEAQTRQPLSPQKGAQQPVPDQHTPKPKEVKEVRHRYLFAIEDPFELDHNVARTVTHNGIVAIRDEFRRAWRIIKAAGKGQVTEALLEDVKTQKEESDKKQFMALLDEIHGTEIIGMGRVVV